MEHRKERSQKANLGPVHPALKGRGDSGSGSRTAKPFETVLCSQASLWLRRNMSPQNFCVLEAVFWLCIPGKVYSATTRVSLMWISSCAAGKWENNVSMRQKLRWFACNCPQCVNVLKWPGENVLIIKEKAFLTLQEDLKKKKRAENPMEVPSFSVSSGWLVVYFKNHFS